MDTLRGKRLIELFAQIQRRVWAEDATAPQSIPPVQPATTLTTTPTDRSGARQPLTANPESPAAFYDPPACDS